MNWQVIQVTVQPGRHDGLLRMSQTYAEKCLREEPGNRLCTFLLDETYQARFAALEQYADRPTQEARAKGKTLRRWAPDILPLLARSPVLFVDGDQFERWPMSCTLRCIAVEELRQSERDRSSAMTITSNLKAVRPRGPHRFAYTARRSSTGTDDGRS